MALHYNNIEVNVLASYEYLRGKGIRTTFADNVFQDHKNGKINLMVDSGAFSVFQNNKERIKIEDYNAFLKSYHEECNKYVMLDVIGDQKETELNFKRMVKNNLRPMFVATMKDKDLNLLSSSMEVNRDICVAGGFTSKGNWLKKRFQDIYKKTNNQAQIHGLAYVNFKDIFRLPLKSVDSSSWTSGKRYGTLSYFIEGHGVKSCQAGEILTGKGLTPTLKKLFNKYKVKQKHFKGQYMTGNKSVIVFFCILCHYQYQVYAKKQKLDYFLAIASNADYLGYMKFIELYKKNELSYESWRNQC